MKSILFVINTLGRGGAEAALIAMLKELDPKLYDVDLYVMLGQGDLVKKLPDHVHLLNESFDDFDVLGNEGRKHIYRHLAANLLRHGSIFRNFFYLISNYFEMRKAGRVQMEKLAWRPVSDSAPRFEKKYDLGVAYLEGASAYYVSDYVKADRKACFIHIDYESSGYTRKLDKDCYSRMDRIFAVSKEVRDSFLRMYPELSDRVDIMHNIVDKGMVLSMSEEPGGFEDDFRGKRILTVARLNKQKALDVSIRAMKRLLDEGYDMRWYVLGEGEERKSLEALIHKLDMDDRFLLCGIKENPYPYFRQCDIYVHCSRFEGRSIAIQEAEILGCPVIVSDCPGNREQVMNEVNGLLVPFEEEAIAAAVRRLADDPAYAAQLGENAALINNSSEDLPKLLELLGEEIV